MTLFSKFKKKTLKFQKYIILIVRFEQTLERTGFGCLLIIINISQLFISSYEFNYFSHDNLFHAILDL